MNYIAGLRLPCVLLTLIIIPLTFCSVETLAADVTLAWDAPTWSGVAGYKLHYGTASRTYKSAIDVHNVTSYMVSNLTDGTYYFAVTAYNASGVETGYSNEVSTSVGTSGSGCDVNGDGSVNIFDLQAIDNAIRAGDNSAGYDTNHDGSVNIFDIQVLDSVIRGLRSCP
jgi:hypothetical protein